MRKSVNLLVSLVVIILTPSFAFAQGASGGLSFFSGLSGLGGLVPVLLIFVFFYLLMIRPQQKKAKEHQNLLNALKKDDRVVTAGGVYATVSAVRENIIEVKVANGVCIQVAKQSIASVITKESQDTAAKIPEIVKK